MWNEGQDLDINWCFLCDGGDGTMTLSSSLSSMGSAMTGMRRVLISGSGTGVTGGWSPDVSTVRFKHGDRCGGGCCANPGVLL